MGEIEGHPVREPAIRALQTHLQRAVSTRYSPPGNTKFTAKNQCKRGHADGSYDFLSPPFHPDCRSLRADLPASAIPDRQHSSRHANILL
jgi:hypothetical protein